MSMTRPTATEKPAREARANRPALYLASVTMADGSDINSPEAQLRIARAGLSLVQTLKPVPAWEANHAAD